MKTEVVKGSTVAIQSTVYADIDNTIPADITGADITVLVKKLASDPDSATLITKVVGGGVTITSGPEGLCETILSALDMNNLSYNSVFYEILVNLATGVYIRSGVEEIVLKPNLIKTLN